MFFDYSCDSASLIFLICSARLASSCFACAIRSCICFTRGSELFDIEKNPMLFSYVTMSCSRVLYFWIRISFSESCLPPRVRR